MKILAFYPYVPWPLNRGAYHRAYHLLKGLTAEHQVDLLALAENGEGAEHASIFKEFCRTVKVIPFQHPPWQRLIPNRLLNGLPATVAHWTVPGIAPALRSALQESPYDAVHVLDIVLAQYFLAAHRDVPLVLDRTRVDLQYQLMEQKRIHFGLKARTLNWENVVKLWAFEKRVANRCAMQVVCGPDDEAFVRQRISRRVPVTVIPNGVDLEYFRSDSVQDGPDPDPTLIFCGAMDYNPNVDALRWFFSEMYAGLQKVIPNLRLLIVGKDPLPEVCEYANLSGVTVTGGVPDVRPYYKRAWLQIVPLRIGGGTRLKIVESLGMGTPVISTRIGAQGLDLVENEEVFYAESPEEFIAQTSRALLDAGLRARLAVQGRNAVSRRLSWTKLGRTLSDAYSALLGLRGANMDSETKRRLKPQLLAAGKC